MILWAIPSKILPLLASLVDISRPIRVMPVILISAQWLKLSLDSFRRYIDIFKESRVTPSVIAQSRIQGFPRDHAWRWVKSISSRAGGSELHGVINESDTAQELPPLERKLGCIVSEYPLLMIDGWELLDQFGPLWSCCPGLSGRCDNRLVLLLSLAPALISITVAFPVLRALHWHRVFICRSENDFPIISNSSTSPLRMRSPHHCDGLIRIASCLKRMPALLEAGVWLYLWARGRCRHVERRIHIVWPFRARIISSVKWIQGLHSVFLLDDHVAEHVLIVRGWAHALVGASPPNTAPFVGRISREL